MSDIVLSTLNARYHHCAFGLRYLKANLGDLESRACIAECDISQRPVDIAEALLAHAPKILGLGVYVWNVRQTEELVAILKRLRPALTIVLGGPEVSYELESQPIVAQADYVITGEADLEFARLCEPLLSGRPPGGKIIPAAPPDLAFLRLPYDFYTDQDLAHRVLYVEASRGCPFSCEFCLSSLDIPVRQAPLDSFLEAIGKLLDRGARHLKFVDRTFNLDTEMAAAVLEFLLQRGPAGRLFHFELIPDRLPLSLRKIIARFPPGSLQFEVGIQTFNEDVAARVQRRQNHRDLVENLQFLRNETGAHIHADLIAGLPGESLSSFAAGFDRLVALGPHEIQVGILKRLRGTPIGRHDPEWQMTYSPQAPYELLQNRLLDFATVQKLKRFARCWDLVANSGNFMESTPRIWSTSADAPPAVASPFAGFMRWTDWLFFRTGRTDSIALVRLARFLFEFLTRELGLDPAHTAEVLNRDYQRGGRKDNLAFPAASAAAPAGSRERRAVIPKRQARRSASAI